MTTQPSPDGHAGQRVVRRAAARPPRSVPSSAQADVSSLVRGLRSRPPREHAVRGVEDRAPARPLDDRDLDIGFRARGRPRPSARTLASGSSKRTIPSGAPPSSRTSAEFDTTRWPVSAERYGCETCTPPGRVPSVARKNASSRTSRASALAGASLAAHHAGALAAVEPDRRRRPDEARLGPLEGAERAVDRGRCAAIGGGEPVAECRVAGQQAERQPGAREQPAHGLGLAVGLERQALIEPRTRLGVLGDRERDADEREQQARDQCGGGGVAHADEGAGPPRIWSKGLEIPPPRGGTLGKRSHQDGGFTVSSPDRHDSTTQCRDAAAHGAGGPAGAGGCSPDLEGSCEAKETAARRRARRGARNRGGRRRGGRESERRPLPRGRRSGEGLPAARPRT